MASEDVSQVLAGVPRHLLGPALFRYVVLFCAWPGSTALIDLVKQKILILRLCKSATDKKK